MNLHSKNITAHEAQKDKSMKQEVVIGSLEVCSETGRLYFKDYKNVCSLFKRISSVLFNNAALFVSYLREAALDMKSSIQAVLKSMNNNEVTLEILKALISIESYLYELSGTTLNSCPIHKKRVREEFNSRRRNSPAYANRRKKGA